MDAVSGEIVTCPIGTDCGRSAPVVGLYRQPRLAEGVLLYTATMWHDEDVRIHYHTSGVSRPTNFYWIHQLYSGRGAQLGLLTSLTV